MQQKQTKSNCFAVGLLLATLAVLCGLFFKFVIFGEDTEAIAYAQTPKSTPYAQYLPDVNHESAPAEMPVMSFSLPGNWKLVSTTPGINIYRDGTDYFILANLKNGAGVEFLDQVNKNGRFMRKTIGSWHTDLINSGKNGCVGNLMHFEATATWADGTVKLWHPYRKAGTEYPGLKRQQYRRAMVPLDDRVIVMDINNKTAIPGTNFATGERADMAGLAEKKGGKGRTMVAAVDSDRDGITESIGLLVMKDAKHNKALKTLYAMGIPQEQIVVFDGGGSSQLQCGNKVLVPSADDRAVPIAIAIYLK